MCVPSYINPLIWLEADIKKFTEIPTFCLKNPKKQMILSYAKSLPNGQKGFIFI